MREYLEQVGATLTAAREREQALAAHIERLEAAPADPASFTRDQLMTALGAKADAVLEKRARQAQSRIAEARTRAEREVRAELEAARARGRETVVEAQAARDRIMAELESKREEMEARRDRLQAEIAVLEQGRDRMLEVYRRVRQAVGVVEGEGADDVAAPAPAAAASPAAAAPEAPRIAEAPTAVPEADDAPTEEVPLGAEDGVHQLFARLESEVTRPKRKPARASKAAAPPAPEPSAVPLATETTGPAEAEEPEDGDRAAVGDDATTPETDDEADRVDAGGPVDAAIAARDVALAPIVTALIRHAKRAVQDEQNALLDALRQRRPSTDPLAVVPPLDEHAGTWSEMLRPALDRAYTAAYVAEAPAKAPNSQLPEGAPDALVSELAHAVVMPLRERVIGALRGAPDADALGQRVSARYREWRGQYLEPVLIDTLAIAYARGVYDGSPEGSLLRWVPNQVGQCPDADDNALEPTRRGGQFPTGQQYPPAHPGCRCVLAVVDEDADDHSRAKPSTINA